MTTHGGKPIGVAWLFSLARSGSSITAYAAAHAAGAAVADEVLGPWDRTVPPYSYPTAQAALARSFKVSRARLTGEIARDLAALLDELAHRAGTDRVVSKHPHLRFTPDELTDRFPDHAAAWLIRNPLKRLASIHARGWTSIVRPNHDLEFFREYAERWLDTPEQQRLIFEDLRRDPAAYFAALFSAWEWPADDATIARAVAYQRSSYHGASGQIEPHRSASAGLSDTSRTAPREAVDLYLNDPFMQNLFQTCGWSLSRADYLPTFRQRVARRVRRSLARGAGS
ncbi:MAG: hypothetical protein AAGF47_10870 [Planctomycetota bacterium]